MENPTAACRGRAGCRLRAVPHAAQTPCRRCAPRNRRGAFFRGRGAAERRWAEGADRHTAIRRPLNKETDGKGAAFPSGHEGSVRAGFRPFPSSPTIPSVGACLVRRSFGGSAFGRRARDIGYRSAVAAATGHGADATGLPCVLSACFVTARHPSGSRVRLWGINAGETRTPAGGPPGVRRAARTFAPAPPPRLRRASAGGGRSRGRRAKRTTAKRMLPWIS